MSQFGAPPVIPASLQQYNSYAVDPKWQKKFSIVWATAVGVAIVASLPSLIRSIRNGRAFCDLFGVREDFGKTRYTATVSEDVKPSKNSRKIVAVEESAWSIVRWSIPGVELTGWQMLVIAAYLILLICCIVIDSELIDNPNRGGFLALAQFPVVFLFATKNSIVSLLLGPGNGYEKLNYIHRWSGRGMFIGATVHGALWIRNHLQFGLPILGPQKETSGVASFALLCGIVLLSLRPIRRFFYQFFFITHVLGYVAFFITICYHTPYASPWIFPPLAFYGFDLLLRMLRYRIKDAVLLPVGKQMTLIHVNDCDFGWTAGQHVRLRVFFSGRLIESHPLTIMTAPPATSSVSTHTLLLAARATGDWTRALHKYAMEEQTRLAVGLDKQDIPNAAAGVGVPVQVMLDGPYGGCSVDLGQYESVLLVAGGSGATFTIGLLDDIVARCLKLGRRDGEKTRRIEFAWCIRSYGCIEWFAPMLMDIANTVADTSLDLHISIFVTCLCSPEDVPPIPNSDVTILRPSVSALLRDLVTPSASMSSSASTSIADDKLSSEEQGEVQPKLDWVGLGGGVAVCAAGPESLTREAQNAVARLGLTRGIELGGIGIHTELFAL